MKKKSELSSMEGKGHSYDSTHLGPEDKPAAENLIPLSFLFSRSLALKPESYILIRRDVCP